MTRVQIPSAAKTKFDLTRLEKLFYLCLNMYALLYIYSRLLISRFLEHLDAQSDIYNNLFATFHLQDQEVTFFIADISFCLSFWHIKQRRRYVCSETSNSGHQSGPARSGRSFSMDRERWILAVDWRWPLSRGGRFWRFHCSPLEITCLNISSRRFIPNIR